MRRLRQTIKVVMLLFVALIITMCAALMNEDPSSCLDAGDVENLTVKGVPIDEKQAESATAIVEVGISNGVPTNGLVVAIMTAMQEATLRPINYGYPGSTSLGLFQQIEAWGPRSDRLDPKKSAEMFYLGGQAGQSGLTDIPGWQKLPLTVAAQSVQRSAYPEAYAVHEREATNIVSALTSRTDAASGEVCEETTPIDIAVQAAREFVGRKPTSAVSNGAELVAAAYAKANITLPKTAKGLAMYKGDESAGIKATWYPASVIASGAVSSKPGDIPCYSTVPNPTREDCETVGMYETSSSSIDGLTVATYNVRGSSHTPKRGPNSGLKRIETSAALIKSKGWSVVGLQELQQGQRNKLMRLLGSGYAIHPETANYGKQGRGKGIESVNSIVVDLSQVDVISRSRLPMPDYFNGNDKSIPLLKLMHLDSGLEFYVTNTHDPADVNCRCAKYRKGNADARAKQMDALSLEGIPIFATGDYNSGFAVRSKGNITLGGVRENLSHCIITKSGTMVNSWDAFKHQTRSGCSPRGPRGPRDNPIDHIFVSQGTEVTRWETISRSTAKSDHPIRWIAVGTPGKATPKKASELGYYIGLNPKTGRFDRLPLVKAGLVGILRLTISQPTMGLADGEWVAPIPPKDYRLSAVFGQGGGLWASDHTGQDFAAPLGTPVRAVTNGEVSTETGSWHGNMVIVRHPDGSETWYAHLNSFEKRSGSVSGGEVIGYVGSTGNSTGPHLHLELHLPDGKIVDPMTVLRRKDAV